MNNISSPIMLLIFLYEIDRDNLHIFWKTSICVTRRVFCIFSSFYAFVLENAMRLWSISSIERHYKMRRIVMIVTMLFQDQTSFSMDK